MKITEILKQTFENLDYLIPDIKSFQDQWYFSKVPEYYIKDEEVFEGMPTVIQFVPNSVYYQQWFGIESEDIFTGFTIFIRDGKDYQRYYYDLNKVLNFRLKVYSSINSVPVELPISDDTYFNLSLQQEMKLTHQEMTEIEKYCEDYKEIITKYKLNIEIVVK